MIQMNGLSTWRTPRLSLHMNQCIGFFHVRRCTGPGIKGPSKPLISININTSEPEGVYIMDSLNGYFKIVQAFEYILPTFVIFHLL